MPSKKSATKRSPADESQRDLSTGAGTGGRNKGRGGNSGRDAAKRTKRSDAPKGISGVPGSKNDSRRCTATAHRTGERCKAPAILGGTVCRVHGGATPNVKKKAKERLLELVDPALAALHKVLTDPASDDSVKVRAALGILDRTGHGPGSKIEVSGELTRFEQVMIDVYGVDMVDGKPVARVPQGGVQRSELEGPDDRPALGRGVGADDHWEDLDQAQRDAQADAWREYDIEDERPYSTRIESSGPIVQGEVVNNDPPGYGRGRR